MIEVVSMVYRSDAFLRFIEKELPTARIVANDPEPSLTSVGLDVYHDPHPDDHYLSRVYRCWNYCVESSPSEYVCLVNSDMAFSPNWLVNLERRLDGSTLPCSRLVEPGYIKPNGHELVPGEHAIQADFGRSPDAFPREAWLAFASENRISEVRSGGLFMPCVLHRETFLKIGGYPDGNVNGISGDVILFEKMAAAGFRHVTCFDSLVYHMQEGEMRPE